MNIHVVALNETGNYNITDEDRPYIAKIRGVYLFDIDQHTNVCELTPSYYLIHLCDQVILTPAGTALDDDQRDCLYQTYEYCDGKNSYYHCHEIDTLIKTDPDNHCAYGDSVVEGDYDEQIKAVQEYLCANCPL